MTARPSTTRHNGFTLLEVVIAMLLLTVLFGMVAGIARSSLALGNSIVATQNEEMLHQAFFELLSQRFSSLPGNTRFNLSVEDSSSQYLSDLTLQKVPLSFTWGGQTRIAKAVQLSTVRRRSGFLSIVLRYFENEILPDSEAPPAGTSALDNEPFAEVELLSDVAYFEWRLLDSRTMEWVYDWDIQGRLPLQLELTLAFGAQGEEIRQIFWIAPKQNPEVVLREIMQGGGSQTSPAQPGGGQPPTISLPGGNVPGGSRGGSSPGGSRGGSRGGAPGGASRGAPPSQPQR